MSEDVHEKHVIGFFRKKLVLCTVDHFGHNLGLKLIQPCNSGSSLIVLFLTCFSILSCESIGKRIQNKFPKVYWENYICVEYTFCYKLS